MKTGIPKVLLIGYGNPGRLDDGLGPALAAKLEKASIEGLTIDADYQLTVEDAHEAAEHDIVIFADAAVKGAEPFSFEEIQPASPMSFSNHSVSPGAVLYFARKMFHSPVRAYLLGIRGYTFNRFEEGLSERADKNLEEAFNFITDLARSHFTDIQKLTEVRPR